MTNLQQALELRRASRRLPGDYCSTESGIASTLSLYLWSGEAWVLPWSALICAWYDETEEREKIVLSFAHHEVTVLGQNLDPIVADIAGLRLQCLREQAGEYAGRSETGKTVVAKITITDPGEPPVLPETMTGSSRKNARSS